MESGKRRRQEEGGGQEGSPVPEASGPKLGRSSEQDMAEQLKCPVCLQLMTNPHLTVCGHSFCLACIRHSLSYKAECPSCKRKLAAATTPGAVSHDVTPNYALATLTTRLRQALDEQRAMVLSSAASVPALPQGLDLPAVSRLIRQLEARRRSLLASHRHTQQLLLQEFLAQMIQRREATAATLQAQLSVLNADKARLAAAPAVAMAEVPEALDLLGPAVPTSTASSATSAQTGQLVPQRGPAMFIQASAMPASSSPPSESEVAAVEGLGAGVGTEPDVEAVVRERRERMATHFEDLETAYLQLRAPQTAGVGDGEAAELGDFGEVLGRLTQYSGVRRLAKLSYAAEGPGAGGLNIVSAIELDRDGGTVAVAGVTRKIKLYDYARVLDSAQDLHYPQAEMLCSSKISSVSWNAFQTSQLASSDYEGSILLWDAMTGTTTQRLTEHEKRCWSVDFSSLSPRLLASGSDDGKVKLWEAGVQRSVSEIRLGVNVCCVQFCKAPSGGHQLAFGSADHCVHLYDVRQTKGPLAVLKGHRKAVSYVKFLGAGELVSASTDSQLRLWDLPAAATRRVLQGHHNEKNFVGLATSADFVACGSENNRLYVYYKLLSRPLFSTPFAGDPGIAALLPDSLTQTPSSTESSEAGGGGEGGSGPSAHGGGAESGSDFVSAIAWRPDSNVLVAANSQGLIQVLQLV